MEQLTRIGMDTSKHIFQLHGVNAVEATVLRKKLRRRDMVAFFAKLNPTVIAIEACGGLPPLGAAASVVRPRGEADRAAAGQALRQAR